MIATEATRPDKATSAKRENTGWEMFGKVALFMLFLPASLVWYGYVIMRLWDWFVVPAFHVAPLALVTAIGIDLLVTTLRGYPANGEKLSNEKDLGKLTGKAFGQLASWPTMLLVLGWLIHLVSR